MRLLQTRPRLSRTGRLSRASRIDGLNVVPEWERFGGHFGNGREDFADVARKPECHWQTIGKYAGIKIHLSERQNISKNLVGAGVAKDEPDP